MKKKSIPLSLNNFNSFMNQSIVKQLFNRFERDVIRAKICLDRVYDDLLEINKIYMEKNKRTLFTTIDGRVKEKKSFFKKLCKICKNNATKDAFTEDNLSLWYSQINDLAGMRFSTPYYDEVEYSINKLIRPHLQKIGYGIDLSHEGIHDKNYLDDGDENGYRSYHFYLKVPTIIDIYGNTDIVICEIQGRSELQHIWAVKSHDLMYKPKNGWVAPKKPLLKDMKELSNNLRSVDHFLVNIRKQVKGE